MSGIIGQIIYINNNNDIIFNISNNKKSSGNDLFLMDKRINLIWGKDIYKEDDFLNKINRNTFKRKILDKELGDENDNNKDEDVNKDIRIINSF